MPELTFDVRWPDNQVERYYSPSLVVHDHLSVGDTLTVASLVARTTLALAEASERVRAKYGVACTSAAASAASIRAAAARYSPNDSVAIVGMLPAPPRPGLR